MTLSSMAPSRHLLPALVFALFGFATSTLYAADNTASDTHQQADHPSMDHGQMGMGMNGDEHGGMEKHPRMSEELNLNDKQRELFKSAMKQRMGSMRGERDLHEQLRELTKADKYDEKKVRDLVRQHNKESEDSIIKSSRAMHEFYQSLSAEQKTKMDTLHQDMKQKMKEHMKDRMDGKMDKQCDEDELEDAGE